MRSPSKVNRSVLTSMALRVAYAWKTLLNLVEGFTLNVSSPPDCGRHVWGDADRAGRRTTMMAGERRRCQ